MRFGRKSSHVTSNRSIGDGNMILGGRMGSKDVLQLYGVWAL
jgi:hypothetical protein